MTAPRERAERELGRVLTRLAALGPSRLSGPAAVVRPVLQQLADAAAAAEGRAAHHHVPALEDRALGDQLAVLGRDLLAVGDDAALDRAATALEESRRAL